MRGRVTKDTRFLSSGPEVGRRVYNRGIVCARWQEKLRPPCFCEFFIPFSHSSLYFFIHCKLWLTSGSQSFLKWHCDDDRCFYDSSALLMRIKSFYFIAILYFASIFNSHLNFSLNLRNCGYIRELWINFAAFYQSCRFKRLPFLYVQYTSHPDRSHDTLFTSFSLSSHTIRFTLTRILLLLDFFICTILITFLFSVRLN